ncbi:MAG TPA: 7TM diverse intracellular signaling domain-containing protein [Cytophagaceae bacterium]|jgi:signal transduction histidine kinase|nr:7TM diverse intracellular signaling domain-containing protein [Cytophagaceae bacterium]
MKLIRIFCIYSLLLLVGTNNSLGNVITFSDSISSRRDIGNSIMILEDPSGKLSVSDVLSSINFKPSTQMVPNLGVSSSYFWIKFQIKNISSSNELLLELAQPTMDDVEFYTILPDGKYLVEKRGEHLPFKERKYNHQNFLFKLNIQKNQTYTFLLKIRSGEEIQVPLSLGLPESIFESIFTKDLISGIYFGIILVMIFYNFFIYLTVRDKSYLYYVIYIFFVGLVQASLQGYTYKYIWPDFPWLATQSVFIVPALSGFGAISFLRNFLQTKKFIPSLDKGLFIFIVLYFICITLSIIGLYNISFQILQVNSLGISFYILFLAYKISQKGYRPAKFFLLGWSLFLGGVFIHVLKNVGVLPYNTFTYYCLQIGSSLEIMLLSFALADRINILKKEKEDSQAEALQVLKENERIIKQQNIILDIKVTERTEELQKSNTNLNATLKNLKETQSKLVDAEKMASLGQLTAGIAHEINNPINFVTSSVKPLKRDIDDIIKLLDKFEEVSMEGDLSNKLQEIRVLKKQIDIDYIKEEINTLINGIDEGATRTAEIVKGLRNFSRLDELDLKMADLNEGISSTLAILKSDIYGRNINIIKEFGNISKIECYPGKLNQVFMNILNNAIHAVSSGINGQGIIIITTIEEQSQVIIKIKDNGVGIPEAVKNKIFEPFFTTKDVGQGVGLGLSIAFNIIEMHQGQIKVESQPGMGTEFTIILPKFQKK